MRINNPLSDQQLKQGDLIDPGIYIFEVMQAEEARSKSGNEMIKLKLRVHTIDNRERIIYDYLLEALEFKVGHFAEATGLLPKYKEGVLSAEDCIGKSGTLKIVIQSDKTGQYGDKNAVADYIPTDEIQAGKIAEKAAKKAAESDAPDFIDSDLPF